MIRLFAWKDKKNFGDELSADVVEWVSGQKVELVAAVESKKLLAVGSILQKATTGDIIWGSGIHPYGFEDFWKNPNHKQLQLHVLAVRGPYTADALRSRGINCPDIFGDPGVLTPLIYPKTRAPIRKVAIIPHLSEYATVKAEADKIGLHVINPATDWRQVVDEIVGSERIISSSLHGLILSDAYGVPSTWLRQGFYEGLIKYHDYFLSTGRAVTPSYSIEKALLAPISLPPSLIKMQEMLKNSFNKTLINEYFKEPVLSLANQFNRVQTASGQNLITPPTTKAALQTEVVADAVAVALNVAQPEVYRDHYPFTAGKYDAPAVVVTKLPKGYHVNADHCRHNVASGEGILIYDTFSHMHQENPQLLKQSAEVFAQLCHKAVYLDTPAASVVNQSTDNYFHWLMQTMPSIIAMQQLPEGKDISYIIGVNNIQWQNQSLDLLGIRPSHVLRATNPITRFSQLFRPSPANYMARNAMIPPFALRAFDAILNAAVGGRKQVRRGRRVYVSRIDAALRKIDNEQVFIDALKLLDFEIILPSKLDLVAQVKAFQDADIILGTHGAGLTNIAFAPKNAKVLEIFPGHYMDGSYFAITQLLGQTYRSHTQKNMHGIEAVGTHKGWSLDIPAVLKWVETITKNLTRS